MTKANISIFVPHAGCPHKCSFCDQVAITSSACPSGESVKQTVENELENLKRKNIFAEIAFFGGSFTMINRRYMMELLSAASLFLGDRITGIRISTRPDAISQEILDILKSYGVTSIELGAQSLCDDVLSLNDRGHNAQCVYTSSQLIKQNGFELGLQMMTGLLGDTFEKSLYTAREMIKIKPDTVRIYPTVVLEGTKLGELYKHGEYNTFDLEQSVELCSKLLKMFEDNGIRVIKLGLHSSADIEKNYLSGTYHPAFRELCEGQLYLDTAQSLLKSLPQGTGEIFVAPDCISKMIGQKRKNIELLEQNGYILKVKPDDTLKKYQIKINIGSI